ncbi:MAG TPA: MotA/TolQ/ExbB proton channel family protein [Rhabdochlamydiaceae bacterium]|nr:MotA/TolQ/ExbB proton channel family protein [Rhabdochlamydiaceae bacterium]
MKKILILTACFSALFAEDPVAAENSPLPVTETATQKIQVASPEIPDSTTPDAVETVVLTKTAELSTESPAVESAPVKSVEGMPKAVLSPTMAPTIVEQSTTIEQNSLDLEDDIAAIEKEEKEVAEAIKGDGIVIDLGQVFAGSPTIYTVLVALSIASVGIWAYALMRLRTKELIPEAPLKEIRIKLAAKQYDEALALCEKSPNILFNMISTGIQSRGQGQNSMLELMKSEGRRSSTKLWQKTSLLNDIAVIAPMIGLLGTVLGMFYAFYDLNRSMESISALFDGLGISVGTTVGGLIVAILALMFHATTKYRLTRQLSLIETQAHSLANLIDNQG